MEKSITMSAKEIKQIPILEQLKRREITQEVAATLTGLCKKQIGRNLKKYLENGAKGLMHKSRGVPSNRKTPDDKIKTIVNLYVEKYPDFGPTSAADELKKRHGIKIHRETLRLILINEGLWTKKRKKSCHRKWRMRKEFRGELVQLDGSDHDWFEGRGPRCTLIGFVDDATGQIFLEFAKNESHETVMKATKKYCLKHGKPLEFYTDRGKVYKVNINNPDNERKTQYERALSELDIKIKHAYSPQAKGRIERLFRTLQDRLVKQLRLEGISDIKSANKFLHDEFIDNYNAKYMKIPAKPTDLHRNVSIQELDLAFCLKQERKLRNDFTISYKNRLFQLTKEQKTIIRPNDIISVWEHFNGIIKLFARKTELFFEEINEREVELEEKMFKPATKSYIPPKNHPWRTTNSLFYK